MVSCDVEKRESRDRKWKYSRSNFKKKPRALDPTTFDTTRSKALILHDLLCSMENHAAVHATSPNARVGMSTLFEAMHEKISKTVEIACL